MTTTQAYWSTSEGQALQWSLIAIGSVLVCGGVIACAAYYCFRNGRNSVKPKVFAGRPVFYIPPSKVVNGLGVTGETVLNEHGQPVLPPKPIPAPPPKPKDTAVHIHHHGGDKNKVEEIVNNSQQSGTTSSSSDESEDVVKRITKRKRNKLADLGKADVKINLPMQPGYPVLDAHQQQLMLQYHLQHHLHHQQQPHPFGMGMGMMPGYPQQMMMPGMMPPMMPPMMNITGMNGLAQPTVVSGNNNKDDDGDDDDDDDSDRKPSMRRRAASADYNNDLRRLRASSRNSEFAEHVTIEGNNIILSNIRDRKQSAS